MTNIMIGDRVRLAARSGFAETTGRIERVFECADATQLFVIRLDVADETGSRLTTAVVKELTKLDPISRFNWQQGDIQPD